MPRIREGYRQLATQVPVDVLEGLEQLAERNGRSLVVEIEHALRRHLESPPVVRVETPPLEQAEIEPPEPKGRGRGRTKKEK